MKKILSIFVAIFFSVSIVMDSFAEEAPLRLGTKSGNSPFSPFGRWTEVYATCVVDDLLISNVFINRESKFNSIDFPKKLRFGEERPIGGTSGRLLEVEVETDHGTWTFKFD